MSDLPRALVAAALINAGFSVVAYGQEAAPETALRQRDDRRLWQSTISFSALTNRDIGELRFVRVSEPPPAVTVATWQSLFYTDNVYQTPHDTKESGAWNGDLSVKLIPYSTGRWTPSIAFDYFMFRYNRESPEDFDGQTLTLASRLAVSDDDRLEWDMSYSLWRFVDGQERSDEFFKQGLLETHLAWADSLLSRSDMYYELAYGISFRHASPSRFTRLENELVVRIGYLPWRRVQLSGFARASIRQYLSSDDTRSQRNDAHVESGIMALYMIAGNLSVSGGATWIWNDSNRSEEDYNEFLPQVSLSAQIAF